MKQIHLHADYRWRKMPGIMATTVQFYTTEQAAAELGVTEGRIRQLCWALLPDAQKHGRDWLLTDADLNRLRNRPDGRKKVAVRT